MSTAETTATSTRGKRSRRGHGARRSRPRGSIDRLDSGSLRVRVDAGADPITGKRHRLCVTPEHVTGPHVGCNPAGKPAIGQHSALVVQS